MTQILITISRQLGSGGSYIGEQVARRLGIRYLDREILGEAANVLQEEAAILERREERVSSFLENFLRTLSVGTEESDYVPPPYRIIYDKDLYKVESEIIRKIARKESAVIVGRAGFHVLKEHPGLVKVFLHAPKKFRTKRVMEIYNIAASHQAEAMIENSDTNRKHFIEKMTGENWSSALNFHRCIDTKAAGFSNVVEAIIGIVNNMQRTTPKKRHLRSVNS